MFSFSTLSHDEPYHLLDTIAFQCIRICSRFCAFPVREKVEMSSINAYAYFLVNICPARTFWNSTYCLLSPFTLDWSRNLWHNPMWNMAVNNISYPIYPLSTRTEKGYITKMIPFFFLFSIFNLAIRARLNVSVKRSWAFSVQRFSSVVGFQIPHQVTKDDDTTFRIY